MIDLETAQLLNQAITFADRETYGVLLIEKTKTEWRVEFLLHPLDKSRGATLKEALLNLFTRYKI